MDEFDRRAIVAACAVLSASIEFPGSQDPNNLEVALQILEKCRDLVRGATQVRSAGQSLAPLSADERSGGA